MPTSESVIVPHELDTVTKQLDERIDSLAYGDEQIRSAALHAAKYIFELSLETEGESKPLIDGLLSSLNPLQKPQTRSQSRSGGQMVQPSPVKAFEPTPLSSLLIEGMDSEQVWMQLELRTRPVCDLLEFALETGKSDEDEASGEDDEEAEDDRLRQVLEALENGEDLDLDALREEFGEEMDLDDQSSAESDESEDSDEGSEEHENEEDIVYLRASDEEHSDPEAQSTLFHTIKKTRSKKKKGPVQELNDGFFDLDVFNMETERTEATSSSRGRLAEDEDDSEDEGMSVDFFAPMDDEVDEAEEGTTDLFYRDFFESPSKDSPRLRPKGKGRPNNEGRVRFHDEVRVKKIKAQGKNLPLSLLRGMDDDEESDEEGVDEEEVEESEVDFEDDDDDSQPSFHEDGWMDEDEDEVEGKYLSDSDDDSLPFGGQVPKTGDDRATIERLKDDLFAEDNTSDGDETLADMTGHEKRQAAIREQITQLEAENVAKKDWTMMGEADIRTRPQNSLLEEDLEFDRVMKPVPVVSEEVVQDLERRIKARILENLFDDVVRIRPLEDKPFLPSRILELQDTKSTQSLAQLYENDYLGGAGDDRDGKLKKEHEEIEQKWEKICSKLDALCNAHFVPKQPKAVISTVSNVATASMESALPTATATSNILAPEEVFNPAPSDTRSQSERTPAEKRALRMKGRKDRKRQRDVLERSTDKITKAAKRISGVKKEKQAALQNIVKSGKGVTVVGKQAKTLKKGQKS